MCLIKSGRSSLQGEAVQLAELRAHILELQNLYRERCNYFARDLLKAAGVDGYGTAAEIAGLAEDGLLIRLYHDLH